MKKKIGQKVVPFLWFDGEAERAARFYVGVFRDARVVEVARYGEAGPGKRGAVMTVTFEIAGQRFIALNAGGEFKFTPAISFFVYCETQREVDRLWGALSAGGKKIQCGWLTDKFGVTWQIVPRVLMELIGDKDEAKSARVMRAMCQMVKLEIAGLKRAHRG